MPPGVPGQDLLILDRQRRVMELRIAGGSYAEIGRIVGCDKSTVCRDIQAVMTEIGELRDLAGEDYRELELARLETLLARLSKRLSAGDPYAVDVARKLSESRRKLLGIDAPTKIAQTDPTGTRSADYLKHATQEEIERWEREALALAARAAGEESPT